MSEKDRKKASLVILDLTNRIREVDDEITALAAFLVIGDHKGFDWERIKKG
jgi:hypothetical protein